MSDPAVCHLLRYYRNLRHHRQYVLEEIRRVAWRNLDVLHDAMDDLGLDRITSEPDVVAVQNHMLAAQGVPTHIVTRSIMGWISCLPWQVYLCLLYAEIESYQRTSASLASIRHPALSDFLRTHTIAVDSLRAVRHKTLHPQNDLALEDAQVAFMEHAARSIGHHYTFVFELQAHLDEFIAWLGEKARAMVSAECDALALPTDPSDADVRRAQAGLRRLKRDAPLWAYRPIPSSGSLTNKILTPVQQLFWISNLELATGEDREKTDPPLYVRRAAPGMWWNTLQAHVLTVELLADATIADGSIQLGPTMGAPEDAGAHSYQEIALRRQQTEMRTALARVTAALLLEPIRIYQDAVQKVPSCRQAAVDRVLPSEAVLSGLRDDRNIVFHVAYPRIDPRSYDMTLGALLDGTDWPRVCGSLIKWNPPTTTRLRADSSGRPIALTGGACERKRRPEGHSFRIG